MLRGLAQQCGRKKPVGEGRARARDYRIEDAVEESSEKTRLQRADLLNYEKSSFSDKYSAFQRPFAPSTSFLVLKKVTRRFCTLLSPQYGGDTT